MEMMIECHVSNSAKAILTSATEMGMGILNSLISILAKFPLHSGMIKFGEEKRPADIGRGRLKRIFPF